MTFYLDSLYVYVTNINDVATSSLCGQSSNDLGKFRVKGIALHSSTTIEFEFLANTDPAVDDMIFGIRNVKILLS